ncbi:MAG: HD domain-containing protein [Candidatus Brocadiae bacterium]|nr:HD domain-containing protein [Candidatus Brocadiia bacterium]
MNIGTLETGQLVTDAVFLVAEARLLVDRRGQNYYNLTLNCEGARQIDGKVWADNLAAPIKTGDGLEVLARVDEYQGKKQLNIQRYTILSPEKHDLSGFVRRTDIDVDQAFETLFNWQRDEFSNPWLKCLSAEFYSNASFAAQFKESPAASRHHHNYTGGLIEHTLEVWNLADGISKIRNGGFDRELLLCGAALHDVGKVKTYRLVAGISERTEVGALLEHVFISGSMVSNLWDNVVRPQVSGDDAGKAARLKALLLHIILSHHGMMEWGSPVIPCTPEAILVHYCDILSATLHSSFNAIEQTQDGQRWTDTVYIMDRPRRLFVTPEDEE